MSRTWLRGGTIVDGTGAPAQTGDLAGCVDPQGIRYILPSVGMRGVF